MRHPAKAKPPLPTGFCFCGCGGKTKLDKFGRPVAYFLGGHDRTAIFKVIAEQYGDVLNFLVAHDAIPKS